MVFPCPGSSPCRPPNAAAISAAVSMNPSPHRFEVMSSVKELRGVPCLLASRASVSVEAPGGMAMGAPTVEAEMAGGGDTNLLLPSEGGADMNLLPSPSWGRGWTATGVFSSRDGTGDGIAREPTALALRLGSGFARSSSDEPGGALDLPSAAKPLVSANVNCAERSCGGLLI